MDKEAEKIAQWGFEVWKEAKSTTEDNWDDVLWETLPEKHKEEYRKSASRLIEELGYRKPLPELRKKIAEIIDLAYRQDIRKPDFGSVGFVPFWTDQILALIVPKDKPPNGDDRVYPCDECGKMRSKNEGGTTFTVCDECWDRLHPNSNE